MKTYALPVLANKQVSQRYWHMVVDTSAVNEPIHAGQFFHILCHDGWTPFLRRPLSIYRIFSDRIEFLYLVKGAGTKKMTAFRPGDRIDVMGPLGEGFTLEPNATKILHLARGVGIATLAAIAQEAAEKNVTSLAVLSARSPNDLLAADELRVSGAEVHLVTDEEGTSDVPNVKRLLEELLTTHHIDQMFTCGSNRLARLAQELSSTHGVPGEIALEEHMGCAMGVCFACVCDIKKEDGALQSVRVCREGPVFGLEEVVLR
ncbi:dihydroorotate dehydrogenase electron transfer subunit [Bacillaceae bacterium SIJ1]|uniref:dihydroorotate dehydrogenase electron transfer subunit n=1 Tax=Litoribacterium kuwaitense TaxID=1398745 RepID=UPI0013EB34CC|nr:dihydroorotate dehydrogenase electron transfer subunit [Litoribacterium kuwaitense]NGP44853.1 dihydroorotate dehydrogenase electron transfer subunit [Litoribacterium kuwaitense]